MDCFLLLGLTENIRSTLLAHNKEGKKKKIIGIFITIIIEV